MLRKSVLVVGVTIVVSGALLAAEAPNQQPPAPPRQTAAVSTVAAADQMFVMDVAKDGMAEVELGKLASEKASNAKVKAFGQKMVVDHGKANDELKTVATSQHLTLPTAIDPGHKAVYDRLVKLSGAEFDRSYVREMVAGHKKAVDALSRESASGKDAEVKAWAAKTLPTIREHLRMIEELDQNAVRSTK
jgi:putative membrane protein